MDERGASSSAPIWRRTEGGGCVRLCTVVIVVALSMALLARPAAADPRPVMPQAYTSPHFVIHYDAPTTAAYAQAAAADFESAYAHLVAGGGGSPNAGFRAPIDSLTDVYLNLPQDKGGDVRRDDVPPYPAGSAFIEMNPSLAADQFKFRAGHEFMHVIEDAYTPSVQIYSLITEGTADWAAGYAHSDTPAGDNNFGNTNRPLDCSYGTWPASGGSGCGDGYWQWLFIERQVESHGVGFVSSLWQQAATYCSPPSGKVGCGTKGDSSTLDRAILTNLLGSYATNLSSAFASYATSIWDPTAWTTAGVGAIMHNYYLLHPIPNPQYVDLAPAAPNSGLQATAVDHLSASYVMVRSVGTSGSSDKLQVTVTKPSSVTAAPVLLSDTGAQGQRTRTTMTPTGGNTYSATVPFDPAAAADVVIALVNDSLTSDAQAFTWRAVLLPGAPSPAPHGDSAGDLDSRVWLGQNPAVDVGHATGGPTETACRNPVTLPVNAVRGVWLLFIAQADGQYTFDSTPSDFTAEMSIASTPSSCWTANDAGPLGDSKLTTTMERGRALYVFIARSQLAIGSGHTIRLTVTGPDGAPFPPEITSPPTGTTTTSDSFTVLGRSAEPGSTVRLYDAGRAVGPSTTAGADGRWSLAVTQAPNGVHAYEVKATNTYGTSGLSTYVLVTVSVPSQPPADTTAPVVTISTPRDGATVTSTPITVAGSATDDARVTSLTVNGTDTTVGAGGAWIARIPLVSGSNTITATATDAAGNRGQAHVTVTYSSPTVRPPVLQPPVVQPPVVQPPVVLVKLALAGPLRFDGRALFVPLRCDATGNVKCRGAITVIYVDRVRARVHARLRTRSVRRVIASAQFGVAQGRSAAASARLNAVGTRLLRQRHRLAVKVTITVTQPSGTKSVAVTRSLTLAVRRAPRRAGAPASAAARRRPTR